VCTPPVNDQRGIFDGANIWIANQVDKPTQSRSKLLVLGSA
jgi:hypothetical protein